MEAATSNIKMDGTTCAGGSTSERDVIDSKEKPKPEKPRTMAARKMQVIA
jgi:hypothetical protein